MRGLLSEILNTFVVKMERQRVLVYYNTAVTMVVSTKSLYIDWFQDAPTRDFTEYRKLF